MFKATGREAVRHLLYSLALDRMLMRRRVTRGQDIGHLQHTDRVRVFTYIYDRGIWRNGAESGSLSGVGSELQVTDTVRRAISDLLKSLGSGVLLDIGCGDFTWMQQIEMLDLHYIGVDIVPSVIEANQKEFATEHRSFACLDAVTDRLPACDVVICREVLFHLSFEDGRRLLHNIKGTGAHRVLLTSDTGTSVNANIRTGDFRLLNLERRPFKLPEPSLWIKDEAISKGRGLGLWSGADL